MLYALKDMAPTVFNWVEALLPISKDQLTKFRQGELKQFSFGSILACFFFKQLPQMRPLGEFSQSESMGPPHAEVGPNHGSYRSG